MSNVSWAALVAAFCGASASVLAIVNEHDDAIVLGLVGIVFALLSHRDA